MAGIRPLRAHEKERLLDLLDGWPFGEGWRGRDFFRRYLEQDPTFSERNVWVADEGGDLVSCAQIFPRLVRARGGSLSMGAIGSVFTRADRRRAGLAGRVLEAAVVDMVERGLEVSGLIASRVGWYRRLGWEVWSQRALALRRHPGPPGPAPIPISRFSPARDLEAVAAIHREYSSGLDGTVIRDPGLWRASLACAGNPEETFLVARREAGPVAYVRAILLYGVPTLSEWGRSGDEVAALVALIDRVFAEGVPGRAAIDELSLPGLPDPALREALEGRGDALEPRPALATMLRCLAPEALSRRFGLAGEGQAMLRSVLAPEHYFFWPSDRF